VSETKQAIPEVVEFSNAFFKPFSNPHFRMSDPTDEKPVFSGQLGEQVIALPLKGIARELGIAEDSNDGLMLDVVGRALRYVTMLQIGDPMPAEMLTGDASWEPEACHRDFSRQRVTMQLVSWLSGHETLITDPVELQQLFDDPNTKKKIDDAFAAAATELGVQDKEQVTKKVEELAEELSYIEALRVRYKEICGLRDKLLAFRHQFRNQANMIAEIDPIVRLFEVPVKKLAVDFNPVDKQTGEILAVLKDLDAQREYIREQRDELHCRLMAWNATLRDWENVNPGDEPYGMTDKLRDLFRFLAPRFMPVYDWILVRSEEDMAEDKVSSAMTW
jgi:hypothetical protein